MISSIIKIVLAILFFICLLDMPYGYFQFVRFVGMVGFVILAYNTYEQKNKFYIAYICLAVLFQPLIKIALGRELWNIVDVVIGVALIASVLIKPKGTRK